MVHGSSRDSKSRRIRDGGFETSKGGGPRRAER